MLVIPEQEDTRFKVELTWLGRHVVATLGPPPTYIYIIYIYIFTIMVHICIHCICIHHLSPSCSVTSNVSSYVAAIALLSQLLSVAWDCVYVVHTMHLKSLIDGWIEI